MDYVASAFVGLFIGGCIWGIIPLIIAIGKKKRNLGIGLMALCGVTAFLSSMLPFWVAIISSIVVAFMKPTQKE